MNIIEILEMRLKEITGFGFNVTFDGDAYIIDAQDFIYFTTIHKDDVLDLVDIIKQELVELGRIS